MLEPRPEKAIGEFAGMMEYERWSCCFECVWTDQECEKMRDLYLEDGHLCCEGYRKWTEEA